MVVVRQSVVETFQPEIARVVVLHQVWRRTSNAGYHPQIVRWVLKQHVMNYQTIVEIVENVARRTGCVEIIVDDEKSESANNFCKKYGNQPFFLNPGSLKKMRFLDCPNEQQQIDEIQNPAHNCGKYKTGRLKNECATFTELFFLEHLGFGVVV